MYLFANNVKNKYMLQQQLTFSEHVRYICRKCIGRVRMLSKLRPIVGQETSLELYKTLVTPLLDYCDVDYYETLSAKDNKELQKMQNTAFKIILQANRWTPTKEIHNKMRMDYVGINTQ